MNKDLTQQYLEKVLSEGLGLDLSDPNLSGTPSRIARMWTEEFFSSVEGEGFGNLACFPNEKGYSQIVMLDRIHFVSMCSHHFLPFYGLAWVGYIPGKNLAGASKPSRLISYYSKKPQLQEALCHEIIEDFDSKVKSKGTIVFLRGIHGGMSMRGVQQYGGSGMMTSAISGIIKTDAAARSEAMDMIKISLMIPSI